MNPLFYTSDSASVIKTYAIYVILKGTILVWDVDSRRGWTFVGTGSGGELSVQSIQFFCGPKTSLKKIKSIKNIF